MLGHHRAMLSQTAMRRGLLQVGPVLCSPLHSESTPLPQTAPPLVSHAMGLLEWAEATTGCCGRKRITISAVKLP